MRVRRVVARCPAKINLHLEVGSRRADGFHEIATIFQAIGLWDRLVVEAADRLDLECDDPGLPTDSGNLALRAARLLRDRHGAPGLGATLSLHKAIPVAAGLGGGSSDAAGALRALAVLWDLDLATRDLLSLAGELGSDVPFFLSGGTALGRGRGDDVLPARSLGERPVVLGLPPFGLSTPEVYARLDRRRADSAERPLTPRDNGVSLPGLLLKFAEENDFALARNDLEAVVLDGWPEIARFREGLLGCGAELAMVSGSGSTVFGLFRRAVEADRASEALSKQYATWRVVSTTTVDCGAQVDHDDVVGIENQGEGP